MVTFNAVLSLDSMDFKELMFSFEHESLESHESSTPWEFFH